MSALPPERAAAWGAIALVVALSGWSLLAQRADQRRVPQADVVYATNEEVAPQLRDRDLVRALPLWFDDARVGFDDASFSLSRELDPWDAAIFDRVVLAFATSYEDQAAATRGQLSDVTTLAEAEGYRIEAGVPRSDVDVHWDALESIDEASVAQVSDENEIACTRFVDRAWHCGRVDEYVYVGAAVQEMDDTWRRCVYATPPPAPTRWRITWDDVPLGDVFRLRAGNTSWAVRMPRGQPVQLRAFLDGELVVERSWAIDEVGYPEMSFDTSSRRGDLASVTIEVGASDHFDRFFCFRAQTVTGSN